MHPLKRTPLNSGVFAVAATAVALIFSLVLRPLIDPSFFTPFLLAVLASAWLYGRAAGVLATALSAVTLAYFFFPPAASWSLPNQNLVARVISFVCLSLLVTWITASWRTSGTMMTATLASISDGVVATDKEGRVTYINPVAAELTGWSPRAALRRHLSEIFRLERDDGAEDVQEPLRKALRESAPMLLMDHLVLTSRAGAKTPVEVSAAPIRDRQASLRGGIVVFRDISGRRHLEEQVSHSQKMDAVGRLAAGVAGDFNNVLTVITGYGELLRTELPDTNPLHHFADEIIWAAERAAGLTRQLLAFSRGPAAQPRLLDVNTTLSSMEAMLRRLLGEAVELIILPGPGLGRVKADPAQVEQVVMNLATNARDAMPQGGKLVIETANVDLQDPASSKKVGVKPGEYVMLAVSDTGVGMDAQTRSRLFEPFFTTKEQGKGSGLGLSIVYGIVRQSEGQITVYSQPDCGTIFEIYLPRVTEAVAAAARRPVKPKGSETILLVDDEEGVRKLVTAILQANGYSIIDAASGTAALAAFEKNAHKIDLVLTDVVMPLMNGFELGERLVQERPEVKLLYMSGYRDSPIGTLPSQANRPFLHKPFTPDILLEKVREVLDARTAP